MLRFAEILDIRKVFQNTLDIRHLIFQKKTSLLLISFSETDHIVSKSSLIKDKECK